MITSLKSCDKAFMDRLKGCYVDDENGDAMQVPVIYISPDDEFILEKLPSFVVMRVGAYPDFYRWSNNIYYSDPNYNSHGEVVDVVKYDTPEPYALYYTIRLCYEYPQDGASMTMFLLRKFRRGAYLEIDKEPYDLSYVSYRNPQTSYKEFGEFKEKELKMFVEQYQYRLDIDLAPSNRGKVKISRKTEFNIFEMED